MNDIWIHPEMSGGGYSAAKVYEGDDFYVSLGGLNGYSHAQQFEDARVILFAFKNFDLTLVGGGKEYDEWREIQQKNSQEIVWKNHVFKLLLSHLDETWFRWLLNDAYNKGTKVGRNDIRSQMNNLLREEF